MFGFKIMKWAFKKLWRGIKGVAKSVLQMFKGLFKIGGKFVNKVKNWTTILGKRIVDKSTKFLLNPIASMLVTTFNFFTGILMSPIKFMEWLIPSVF